MTFINNFSSKTKVVKDIFIERTILNQLRQFSSNSASPFKSYEANTYFSKKPTKKPHLANKKSHLANKKPHLANKKPDIANRLLLIIFHRKRKLSYHFYRTHDSESIASSFIKFGFAVQKL